MVFLLKTATHGIDSFRPRACGSVGLWGSRMYKTSVWRVFLGIFLLSAELGGTLVCADSQWSSWYNSDSPDSGSGDDESVERIALTLGLPCRPDDVTLVQCRRLRHQQSEEDDGKDVDEDEVFDHQGLYEGNVLHVPCNASGLVCRHEDQPVPVPASPSTPRYYSSSSFALPTACADYEIRLQCRGGDTGNGSHSESPPSDVTSHGAFIALVAGGSVVIPLLFVLILRLRKAKLARQRQREAQRPAQPSPREEEERAGEAEAVDAPPAYDLLFASPEPISVISGGPRTVGENLPDPLRSGTARLMEEGRVTGVGHVGRGSANRGYSSVETPASNAPSAERVTEESSEQTGGISRSSNSPRSVSNPNLLRPAASSTSQPSPLSGAGVRRMSSASSSTSSSTLSASSTRALLTPVHSDHDLTHSDPPPAYDWPGHTLPGYVQTPGDDDHNHTAPDGTTPEEPAPNSPPEFLTPSPTAAPRNDSSRPPQRRFLGMHLSILDLMTVMYPDSDSTPTPPPTYDDALKILAVPVSPEVQVT